MVVNNPNNWHWVDKNCIEWSKNYFNQKLVNISAIIDNKEVKVDSVSSVEGDVEVCQRKGKVISLFDLRLILNIFGFSQPNKKGEFKGSITIPELAYDTTPDEIQFDISIYNEDSDSQNMKPLIRSKLIPKLREILSEFGNNLIMSHSSDIQLSSDKVNSTLTKGNQKLSISGGKSITKEDDSKINASTTAKTKIACTSNITSKFPVPKYNTSTLHLESVFDTTAEQLYITLLDKDRITAWSQSAPFIQPYPSNEGSTFIIFGGSVSGKYTKLLPNERITQLWRLENWKTDHYAELDIQFIQGFGETKMVIKWSGIPIGEEERVKDNFESYYVKPIKLTFGFGAVL